MAINMQELMRRVVALEKEALAALSTPVTCDAVPRFLHTQEAFPYWVNRLGPGTIDGDSEDYDVIEFDVLMRLIIAHDTAGYVGETDDKLQTYAPQVVQYFNERELLQSAAYPVALVDLTRARISAFTGWVKFVNSGDGSAQIGCEFTLRCECSEYIEQAYL